MFEMVCGTAVLLIFFGIIGVGYHKHMKAIYDDIAHEEAHGMADEMFDEAMERAEFHVHSRLEIVDEMGRRG